MLKIRTDSGGVRLRTERFPGGERHVQLLGPDWPPHGPTRIRADVRSSDDLVDLLLAKDALDAHLGRRDTYLELPYLPYSRQDRVCAAGQALSLRVLGRLLAGMGLAGIRTWDVHSQAAARILKEEGCPELENVGPELILQTAGGWMPNLLRAPGPAGGRAAFLVRPDEGAEVRTLAVARRFGLRAAEDVLRFRKTRDPSTGKLSGIEPDTEATGALLRGAQVLLGGPVWAPQIDHRGRWAVIADDICDGGGTFVGIAEQLRGLGGLAGVALYVTHGIFSRGLAPFAGLVDVVVSTDSFPTPAAHPGVEYHRIKGPFAAPEEE